MKQMTILVTGAAGFIGSEFIRQGASRHKRLIAVDSLSYSGDLSRLNEAKGKFKFYKADICNTKRMAQIFQAAMPDVLVNFAAQTHVDRSILNSQAFIKTNIEGTHALLDLSQKYGIKKFIHISTDEVYGDIRKGSFTENSPLNPHSPYAASKAAADCLIKAYIKTYKFPALIVRASNNYGEWQYPEKFIPVAMHRLLSGKKIPVYARGLNRREWLHVSDCAKAVWFLLARGKAGEVYNVGSGVEKRNKDIARILLRLLNKPVNDIEFIRDRPGHDFRYFLDCTKINRLGWKPEKEFETGIAETVEWYKNHFVWLGKKARSLGPYWKKVYKK